MRTLVTVLSLSACVAETPPPSAGGDPRLGWLALPIAPPPAAVELVVEPGGVVDPTPREVNPGDTVVWRFSDRGGAVVPVGAEVDGLAGPRAVAGGVFQPDDAGAHSRVVRVRWSDVEPAPGAFDWRALDEAVDAAVAGGATYGLSISAAPDALPGWLDEVGAGPVVFPGCGSELVAADPADPRFAARWEAVVEAAGEHLQARPDRWRALGWVSAGGAMGDGLSLPDRPCDDEVWAERGVTADALAAALERELQAAAAAFPGVTATLHLAGGRLDPEAALALAAAHEAVVTATWGTPEAELVADEGAAGTPVGFRVDGDDAHDALTAAWALPGAVVVEVEGVAPRWDVRFERRVGTGRWHAWTVPDAPSGTTFSWTDPRRPDAAPGVLLVR